MAVITYTKNVERKTLPRIFIGSTVSGQILSDTQWDTLESTGALPKLSLFPWVQLKTSGGATMTRTRNTTDLENDQFGITEIVIDSEPMEIQITLASDGFSDLQTAMKWSLTEAGTTFVPERDQRGMALKNYGFTMLIVGMDKDVANDSLSPGLTAQNLKDPNAWCFYNVVPISNDAIKWDTNQKTFQITLKVLANSSSTSTGLGIRAVFGQLSVTAE